MMNKINKKPRNSEFFFLVVFVFDLNYLSFPNFFFFQRSTAHDSTHASANEWPINYIYKYISLVVRSVKN